MLGGREEETGRNNGGALGNRRGAAIDNARLLGTRHLHRWYLLPYLTLPPSLPPPFSLDWCEANYAVSFYVAEFWNSLSSLAISIVGLVAIFICYHFQLERRFFGMGTYMYAYCLRRRGEWRRRRRKIRRLLSSSLISKFDIIPSCRFQLLHISFTSSSLSHSPPRHRGDHRPR